MSGIRFVQALLFWLLMMTAGVLTSGLAIAGHPMVMVVFFGITWISLVTYWAWKIGNTKEDYR